jgi:hypothetical protein
VHEGSLERSRVSLGYRIESPSLELLFCIKTRFFSIQDETKYDIVTQNGTKSHTEIVLFFELASSLFRIPSKLDNAFQKAVQRLSFPSDSFILGSIESVTVYMHIIFQIPCESTMQGFKYNLPPKTPGDVFRGLMRILQLGLP